MRTSNSGGALTSAKVGSGLPLFRRFSGTFGKFFSAASTSQRLPHPPAELASNVNAKKTQRLRFEAMRYDALLLLIAAGIDQHAPLLCIAGSLQLIPIGRVVLFPVQTHDAHGLGLAKSISNHWPPPPPAAHQRVSKSPSIAFFAKLSLSVSSLLARADLALIWALSGK